MGMVFVQVGFWMLKVSALACFLVLQGAAGFSISPSPSTHPMFPPIGEGAPAPVSHGKAFQNSAPTPASQQNGAFVHSPQTSAPLNFAPAPQKIIDPRPFSPLSPVGLPPDTSVAASVSTNGTIPALPPTAPQRMPQPVKYPVPEISAPIASPGRISTHNPTISPVIMPGSIPPTPPNKAPGTPFLPPTAPELNKPASAPWRMPQHLPPTPLVMPEISPSIYPVASPPSKLPENLPPVYPVPPEKPPPHLSGPTASPTPGLNWSGVPRPLAVPLNGTMNHRSHMNPAPTKGPVASPAPGLNWSRVGRPLADPPNELTDHHSHENPAPTKGPATSPTPGLNWSRVGRPITASPNGPMNHDSHENPASTKGPAASPTLGLNWSGVGRPFAWPPNGPMNHHSHENPSPTKAPSAHGYSDNVPPPLPFPKSPVGSEFHSPASQPSTSFQRHDHVRSKKITPAPSVYILSPLASSKQAPSYHSRTDPKTNLWFDVPPPLNPGSSIAPPVSPFPPLESHGSPAPSQSQHNTLPFLPPKTSPSGSPPDTPKMPYKPPFQAFPPPPPNKDCISLTCSEPFTNGPPGAPCVCVLPMQVGLRLSVALYTFFPLVSELAAEIATGVFLKPSQVRIMGANAASQDPEKTIVLIDLVPLGETFDNTTAYLTFQRFWQKEVVIETSLFGDYEVLYVRYPGLPPSPPSAPSDIDIIGSDPYSGHNNNGALIKPLGVDVGKKNQRGGLSASIIAIIVLSASLAVILCCAIAWVLVFKHRGQLLQLEPTPPATIPSLAKSSGIVASAVGSRPSSTSLSFDSGIPAYTGSAKTFSSNDIERATDNFNETRILGEGGFGRVYSGVLDDGTKVAVKVLKRADQRGGREFLAEVEMLSRLHHRNLVKLIGICTEERARCLVYELLPNGSVESHLHGIHMESAPLDWTARLKIALGAARGLAYLHEDSSPRVIHRDFKSSNILLEHDFTPKVSDFGLARTAMEEENRHISTRVMGTFGYVAPEYAMTGHLLVKSDVYSYGVVLLELLTGRKPVDMSQPSGQENLVSWARPLLTSEKGLESIIDPSLGPEFPFDSISKVAAIASMCVQPEVSHRPFMGEVVQALKLVCNECDETKELGSRTCSQEDISLDVDAGVSNASGHLQEDSSLDMDDGISNASGHSQENLSLDMDDDGISNASGHSQENLSLDMDDGISNASFHLKYPSGQSPLSDYNPLLDVERGTISYSLDSSGRNAMQDFGLLQRHSDSGPLRTVKAKRLWQKLRQLSGGTVSEHSLIFRSWSGSR